MVPLVSALTASLLIPLVGEGGVNMVSAPIVARERGVKITEIRKDENDNVSFGFVTHNDGTSTAKSPEGMFEEDYIPNDLGLVAAAIDKYYGEE